EDEGDAVVAAGVGEPVPAMDALAGDKQSVGEGLDGAEEGLGLGGQVAGEACLPVVVEDDEEEGPGVQIDAGVESGAGRGVEGAHGEGLRFGLRGRRLGATSIVAHERLHEYPNAAADGAGILAFRGTLSSLPAPLLSWLLGRLRRASGEVESGCGPGV